MVNLDLTKGFEGSFLKQETSSNEAQSASDSLRRAAQELTGPSEKGVQFRQAVAEFTGTLAAGITGAVVWSLGTAATRGIGTAGSLGLAMGLGGLVKFGVKSGIE
ncbi:MAG TPA: hypothetical protein V6D08_18955, partial [Candidatus Obscuribacterales bacterium]